MTILYMNDFLALSLLFILPFMFFIFFTYIGLVIVRLWRGIKVPILFHWVDFAIPFIVTGLWERFQVYAVNAKSLSYISELGCLGSIWGILFIWRGVCRMKNKRTVIWASVAIEAVLFILVVLFMPTLPE